MEPEETAPADPVEEDMVLGDDEAPAPDPPKVRPARHPEKPREADRDLAEPDVPGEEAAPTTRSLVRMTRTHPFLGLFVHYARIRYPRRPTIESKVEALIAGHGRFYRWSRILDTGFIALLCLLIAGALAGNIWKVFFN